MNLTTDYKKITLDGTETAVTFPRVYPVFVVKGEDILISLSANITEGADNVRSTADHDGCYIWSHNENTDTMYLKGTGEVVVAAYDSTVAAMADFKKTGEGGGGSVTLDDHVTQNSPNPVKSSGIYEALQKGGYEETVLYEINSTGSNTFSVPIATLRQYDIIGIDAGFYAAGIDPSVYTNRSNNWTYFPVSALPNTIAANAILLDMSAPIVYNEIVRFVFGADNSGNNFVVKETRTHLPANEWPCAAFKAVGFKFKAVPKLGAEDTVLWETQDWKKVITSPRSYSETVLWENTGSTNPSTITLSSAYTNFDAIIIVHKHEESGNLCTSTATYLTSAMDIDDMLGISLGDGPNLYTWYKLEAANELTISVSGLLLNKIIGIKY